MQPGAASFLCFVSINAENTKHNMQLYQDDAASTFTRNLKICLDTSGIRVFRRCLLFPVSMCCFWDDSLLIFGPRCFQNTSSLLKKMLLLNGRNVTQVLPENDSTFPSISNHIEGNGAWRPLVNFSKIFLKKIPQRKNGKNDTAYDTVTIVGWKCWLFHALLKIVAFGSMRSESKLKYHTGNGTVCMHPGYDASAFSIIAPRLVHEVRAIIMSPSVDNLELCRTETLLTLGNCSTVLCWYDTVPRHSWLGPLWYDQVRE